MWVEQAWILIKLNDTGYSYDTVFSPYLVDAVTTVHVDDPYVTKCFQVRTFIFFVLSNFCILPYTMTIPGPVQFPLQVDSAFEQVFTFYTPKEPKMALKFPTILKFCLNIGMRHRH